MNAADTTGSDTPVRRQYRWLTVSKKKKAEGLRPEFSILLLKTNRSRLLLSARRHQAKQLAPQRMRDRPQGDRPGGGPAQRGDHSGGP